MTPDDSLRVFRNGQAAKQNKQISSETGTPYQSHSSIKAWFSASISVLGTKNKGRHDDLTFLLRKTGK